MADDIRDQWHRPPRGRLQRIKHFLHVYEDLPGESMILVATTEVYGRHVRTGVTLDDLRQLYNLDCLSDETVRGDVSDPPGGYPDESGPPKHL